MIFSGSLKNVLEQGLSQEMGLPIDSKISSKQAFRLIENLKPILNIKEIGECFCSEFGKINLENLKIYFIKTEKEDILKYKLLLREVDEFSVVIVSNNNKPPVISVDSLDKEYFNFNFINIELESSIRDIAAIECKNNDQLYNLTKILDSELKIKIMKSLEIRSIETGCHSLSRLDSGNIREEIDNLIVNAAEISTNKEISIASFASGNLQQELIITLMLISRGINIEWKICDLKYENSEFVELLLREFKQIIDHIKSVLYSDKDDIGNYKIIEVSSSQFDVNTTDILMAVDTCMNFEEIVHNFEQMNRNPNSLLVYGNNEGIFTLEPMLFLSPNLNIK